jgi:hypothetical protein
VTKFRKIPVVIEATQWFKNGDHPKDGPPDPPDMEGRIVRYFRRPDIAGHKLCLECKHPFHDHGWIDTLEDGHRVCPSDWIITGIKGEHYPCKDAIFRETYEPADEEAEKLWNK